MNFDSIVFDLDGTLWDTSRACAIAWNGVLQKEGIEHPPVTEEDVRLVTGRPHPVAIQDTFTELPKEEVDRLIAGTETEDNRVIAEIGGTLYPGVLEGIPSLAEKYRLFIVSNCQSGYIETFYRLSGLERFFEDNECFGNTGQHKGENLRRVLIRNQLRAPLMVGDGPGDHAAALFCGVPFAFVSYGFGHVEAPEYVFRSFQELLRALLPNPG